ncbi:hypothetical protein Pfo_022321 [Paulownia fortunei]|nr:hypothetical protein Pfo_022321 [Paulownia fortunei]
MLIQKVSWNRPPQDWIKLNSDGASKGNPGLAGIGGIVRDEFENLVNAFLVFVGETTNMVAEIQALAFGLQRCFERGYHRIWIESDSMAALQLIQHSSKGHWKLEHFLAIIISCLQCMEIRFSYIYREGNKVADALANLACDEKSDSNFSSHNIPHPLQGLLRADKLSLLCFRFRNVAHEVSPYVYILF